MFLCLTVLSAKKSEPIYINLVTTNDLHGVLSEQTASFMNPEYPPDIVGMSAFYKYINDLRPQLEKNGEGLIMLDGGNFFQGHPMGLADSGKTVIDWMNKMGYDALTPGAYDFILGSSALHQRAQNAAFPFLGANLECDGCLFSDGTIKPYIIKDVQGVKVGILGIITSELEYLTTAENTPNIRIEKEVASLEKWLPILKSEGAEVIIILSSNGVPWDREEEYENFLDSLATGWEADTTSLSALQMGHYAEGADLIVTGGNSKGYPLPWYDPFTHVYVMQNYGGGTEFGHIRLKIDRDSHSFIGYETVIDGRVSQTLLEDDFTPEPVMHEWLKEKSSSAISDLYEFDDWYSASMSSTKFVEKIQGEIEFDEFIIPSVNETNTLEVITWNCEFFPANKDTTIHMLAEAIHDLNADLYAFQEIRYPGWFSKMMVFLPDYDYIVSKQSSFMDQAIVFKRDQFRLIRQREPFAENDYNYAGRPPLRGDFMYFTNGEWIPISVINLHMKCCDSGLLRRQNAVKMLHEYLDNEIASGFSNFIVLGDWNDDLKDEENAHCFHPFMQDPRFHFPTWKITNDLTQASYPKEPYVSFLDHILVTESLLPHTQEFKVMTLMVEDYVGGYDIFEHNLSDHRPVLLQFAIQNGAAQKTP